MGKINYNLMDLTDMKYGKLRVLYKTKKKNNGFILWKCRCECGNFKLASPYDLIRNHVKSCGCLASESAQKRFTTHGDTTRGKRPRIYTIWLNMKTRCLNKNNKRYKDYGQRKIKICDDWKNSYQAFKNWALKNGYADNLTIDRINNDGNYEPSNCQWITKSLNTKKYFSVDKPLKIK